MQIKDLMSTDIASCPPSASLQTCAAKMKEFDCGMIPIVEGNGRMKVVGVVTDRDIVCRTLAEGINPMNCTAADVLSDNVITIHEDDPHEEAIELMEDHQLRRLIVLNHNDECVGIVSQADLAMQTPLQEVGEVVQKVSQPGGARPHPQ